MRPDAAARRREAHHQVVEASERQEGKAPQERVGRGRVQVHALHQQRPVARGQRAKIGASKRSVRERPARAVTDDEPRLDVVTQRERGELPGRDNAGKTLERAADEQGFLLPVLAEERRGAASVRKYRRGLARSGRRSRGRHPAIIATRRGVSAPGLQWRPHAFSLANPDGASAVATRPLPCYRSPDEHLLQHRRDADLRALRFRRHVARSDRRAHHVFARRALRHAAQARGSAQSEEDRRRGVGRCRTRGRIRRLRSAAREDRDRGPAAARSRGRHAVRDVMRIPATIPGAASSSR